MRRDAALILPGRAIRHHVFCGVSVFGRSRMRLRLSAADLSTRRCCRGFYSKRFVNDFSRDFLWLVPFGLPPAHLVPCACSRCWRRAYHCVPAPTLQPIATTSCTRYARCMRGVNEDCLPSSAIIHGTAHDITARRHQSSTRHRPPARILQGIMILPDANAAAARIARATADLTHLVIGTFNY